MAVSASNMEHMAYKLADQHIRKAIVKEEQEQDVRFDGLIRTGVIVEGAASEKGVTPQVPAGAYNHSVP